MVKVDIYTSMLCGYCYRAKALLQKKGAQFNEIDVTMNAKGRREMKERSGGQTSVPQIFIDDVHLGGCEDLVRLDREGKLDTLLGLT